MFLYERCIVAAWRLWTSPTPTFSRVYDDHARSVHGAALRILGDPAQAQDVTQDVFLRLWRRPRFDARRGELGSYLRLMARSRALDLCREGQAAGRAATACAWSLARRGAHRRPPGSRRRAGRRPLRPARRARRAARAPARGARARLLGRADRGRDRPPRGPAAGDREEPDPPRAGAGARRAGRGDGRAQRRLPGHARPRRSPTTTSSSSCWPARGGRCRRASRGPTHTPTRASTTPTG